MSNRRGLGPHASRRGLLKAGLAIGTLALGQRAALGQSGGAHVHMPELGVAKLMLSRSASRMQRSRAPSWPAGALCEGSRSWTGCITSGMTSRRHGSVRLSTRRPELARAPRPRPHGLGPGGHHAQGRRPSDDLRRLRASAPESGPIELPRNIAEAVMP
jgi:hypothetical protein